MVKTYQIKITGQVQGVGFRPFVYRLAQQLRLNGTVSNTKNGVLIHLNATEDQIDKFKKKLLKNAPAISYIQSHTCAEVTYQKYADFDIVVSDTSHQINTPLTPDFAICKECKTEIRDINNRRYGYAFTTCTNCGPRFAVTTKFPFERKHTTIAEFTMCTTCQTEYTNPTDRRFHSQTNSCADCGVQWQLSDSANHRIKLPQFKVIEKVAAYILKGHIVALKNTNGYLLCCDANNKDAIARLRKKKQRPSKPFALLYPSIEKIMNDFHVNPFKKNSLSSPVAPIVILNPKSTLQDIAQELIAPKLNQLGVMLPSSALLILLMDKLQLPIVATSGNIHGSPIISKEEDAVKKLSGVADYFLNHNLDISFPQDDSVIRFADEQQIILRRSRGLAPNYMGLAFDENEKVLAMGAHLKSTFTFAPNSNSYVSQYLGNLDNFDVSQLLQKNITDFQKLFQTQPKTILIDTHPLYQSSIMGTEFAQNWKAECVSIQHHKAHFASVLAEHDLFNSEEKILGVVWDGTGFGEDNAIWGGEFFTYQNSQIKRFAHFEYIDWLAADKMAKEPRLSLLSMLPEERKEIARTKFSETEWKVYQKLLKNNSLKTSSAGRLFDAVASLLGLIDITSYEGEAALLLENLAQRYTEDNAVDFLGSMKNNTIPTKTIIDNICNAIENGFSKAQIANSFIYTLALIILKIATANSFKTVACSGGVFQNAMLIKMLSKQASKQKIKLKFNRILSSNDENISFGQLCYLKYII